MRPLSHFTSFQEVATLRSILTALGRLLGFPEYPKTSTPLPLPPPAPHQPQRIRVISFKPPAHAYRFPRFFFPWSTKHPNNLATKPNRPVIRSTDS